MNIAMGRSFGRFAETRTYQGGRLHCESEMTGRESAMDADGMNGSARTGKFVSAQTATMSAEQQAGNSEQEKGDHALVTTVPSGPSMPQSILARDLFPNPGRVTAVARLSFRPDPSGEFVMSTNFPQGSVRFRIRCNAR